MQTWSFVDDWTTATHNWLANTTPWWYNETSLFDRFLIIYNLCVFICIIVMFVFHCTHVRMSYGLNSYLLTYLLTSVNREYCSLSIMSWARLHHYITMIPHNIQIFCVRLLEVLGNRDSAIVTVRQSLIFPTRYIPVLLLLLLLLWKNMIKVS